MDPSYSQGSLGPRSTPAFIPPLPNTTTEFIITAAIFTVGLLQIGGDKPLVKMEAIITDGS